jgi:hypothetical protein
MPTTNPFRTTSRLRTEAAAFILAGHLGAEEDQHLRILLEGALGASTVAERAGDLWDALHHVGLLPQRSGPECPGCADPHGDGRCCRCGWSEHAPPS